MKSILGGFNATILNNTYWISGKNITGDDRPTISGIYGIDSNCQGLPVGGHYGRLIVLTFSLTESTVGVYILADIVSGILYYRIYWNGWKQEWKAL